MFSPTSNLAPLTVVQLKDCPAFLQFPWQNGLALKSGIMADVLTAWFREQYFTGYESRDIDTTLLKVKSMLFITLWY
jgi:hypothetical protein